MCRQHNVAYLIGPGGTLSGDRFLGFVSQFVRLIRKFVPIDLNVSFVCCDLEQDDGATDANSNNFADLHREKTSCPEIRCAMFN